jgi:hypothetical protein
MYWCGLIPNSLRPGVTVPAEVVAEPFGNEGQPVLRLEFFARLIEHVV